jgi:hypothetical protein
MSDEKEPEKQISDKMVVYTIIVILAVFAVFILIRVLTPVVDRPMTIEEAHVFNIRGKLEPEFGYMYGPHSFIRFNDLWYFQVQSEGILVNVPMRFGPKDVEDIPLYGSLDEEFDNAEKVYFSFDPLGEDLTYIALAVGELTQSLTKAFGNEVAAVCSRNCSQSECDACQGRPILDCSNKEEAIISLIETEQPRIVLKGNCIEVQGSGLDLVRQVDRLLLEFYGVIKTEPEQLS